MHPTDAMFYWAKFYPRRLAILLPYMAITYQAMAEAIAAASERIERLELNRSESVAVAIDDPAKLIAVCHALVRNGIACAPILQTMVPHLRSHNINTLIFSGVSDVIVDGRNIRFDDFWLRPSGASRPAATTTPSDSSRYGALIFFTSGTTGVPKKVIMSSRAFIERVNILPHTGEAAHSRTLISPGLASVFGFNRAATVLYAGKTLCFAYGPEAQLRFIVTFGIDVIVASVQQILDILAVLEKGAKYRSESLKEVWISGGYASDDVIRRIQSKLCRNVLNVYGSSESGFAAAARYDMISHVPQAVGFVRPDMQIEIVDVAGNPLPAGEEGLVRGHSSFIAEVFAAHDPDRAAEARDAWWYPGDLGRLTEDGILCISGRTDEVINMGGVKVVASLLDERVRGYPGVKDAGTCGVLGQSGMDEVWVGIVTDADIDMTDLKRSIEESQSEAIKIGEIFVVEHIPRNDLGKLQRHELKALLLGIKSRALSDA
jgi:acyl-coenzyme A synthetase/AMP-(fatty) acid ligase